MLDISDGYDITGFIRDVDSELIDFSPYFSSRSTKTQISSLVNSVTSNMIKFQMN